jgi:hypothetical protein
MTIQDLGNIGEFIASIGVVVSLIYLALQTRDNTKAIRAQTRSALTDQVLSIQSQTFQSDAYRHAFQKLRLNEELDELEEDLLNREALLYFKHMENAQFQFENGLYDANEYKAQREVWVHRFEIHPPWRYAWELYKPMLSPRLIAEVQPIVDRVAESDNTNDA